VLGILLPLLAGLLFLIESGRSRTEDPGTRSGRSTEREEALHAPLPPAEAVLESAARSPAALPVAPGHPDVTSGVEPRPGELRGRVLDPQRTPVPGARVSLRRGIAREFMVLDLEAAHAAEEIAETTSDAQGEFRFALARGIPVDLVASGAGFVDTVVPDRYAGEFVEVTLSPGCLVFGRITRERDGSPVEGAEVRVFRLGGPSALARETTSDADGRYELRFAFREDPMLEVVSRNEQSSDWIDLVLGPDGTVEKDVALKAGVLVEGRVTDSLTGSPIQGAIVGEGWVYRRTAATDALGEYRLEGFGNPGMAELFAKAKGYGESKKENLPGAENGLLHVDFELAPGHAARGRVLDPGGRPIEGAYVAAVASQFGSEGQETDWLSARTDEEGRFRIDSLTPGLRHALFARKHGWATHVWDFPPTEVVENETDLGDLVLTPPALIAGRVEDDSEQGIADVEVILKGWNRDRGRLGSDSDGSRGSNIADFYVASREVRSDARGRFWFGGVAAGSYTLGARKRGWAEPSPIPVEVEEGNDQEDLVLRVGGGSTIRGRVVDEDGRPVAKVHLSPRLVEPENPGTSEQVDASAQTDAGGTFAFRGLPSGEYRIDVYPFWIAEWDPDAPWLQTTIERARTGTDDLVIVMEKGANIGGVLLDAAGKPLFGYWISPAGNVRTTGGLVTTDLEGRFTIGVPRGTVCDIEVRGSPQSRDYGTVLLTQPGVAAGTTNLVLQLEP